MKKTGKCRWAIQPKKQGGDKSERKHYKHEMDKRTKEIPHRREQSGDHNGTVHGSVAENVLSLPQ